MTKELVKAGDILGVSQEDVDTYEETFENSFTNEKGKWGKMTIRKNESIGNNKIIVNIDEECVADIVNELYNPIGIATIKCIVNIAKIFSSVFKKCEKSFDKIYTKWFNE